MTDYERLCKLVLALPENQTLQALDLYFRDGCCMKKGGINNNNTRTNVNPNIEVELLWPGFALDNDIMAIACGVPFSTENCRSGFNLLPQHQHYSSISS